MGQVPIVCSLYRNWTIDLQQGQFCPQPSLCGCQGLASFRSLEMEHLRNQLWILVAALMRMELGVVRGLRVWEGGMWV